MRYYAKQAFKILQKEGLISLIQSGTNFIRSNYTDQLRLSTRTYLNQYRSQFAYTAPADPHKLLWINANEITHHAPGFSPVDTGLGYVTGGEWDQQHNLTEVAEHWKNKGIRQRFEEGYDWEDTLYYQGYKDKLSDGSSKRLAGYGGLEEFLKARCDFVDQLYESIKTDGYQPNSIGDSDIEAFGTGYGQSLEILTLIGRDGQVYFQGKGKHRLAIAQILDLEIPVQVVCRHQQWQQTRDQLHTALVSGIPPEELRSKYPDHPDLIDVLPR